MTKFKSKNLFGCRHKAFLGFLRVLNNFGEICYFKFDEKNSFSFTERAYEPDIAWVSQYLDMSKSHAIAWAQVRHLYRDRSLIK